MTRATNTRWLGWMGACLLCVLASGIGIDGSPARAVDQKGAGKPATAQEAARMLDLRSFPTMNGAKQPVNRSLARLSYRVASDCKTAFEFQRKALKKLTWSEAPGSSVTDQYASGMFTRGGFNASISTMPSGDPRDPGTVNVSITLLGNVNLGKLPIPPGLKAIYSGPQIAMYATEASVELTIQQCRQLLTAQGWQPYGRANGTLWFKQNAIRLTAAIGSAPAQGGKTSVSFSAEQLSADVPAPADTLKLQYADSTKQVSFDTKGSQEQVVAFYRSTLGKAGWKATTDKTAKISFKDVMIFRNDGKDMFTLEMYPVKDEEILRVSLQHQSAAEVAAIEKRLKERAAARKAKTEKEKNTPATQVKIALPADAKVTEESKTRLRYTVGTGKADAIAKVLRKSLVDAGWKEEAIVANAMVGEITFKKGNQELSLSYLDPGVIPAEFTVQGRRVELLKTSLDK